MLEASDMPAEERPLHVLNRLGFGPRPGDVERVKVIGPEHYIHEQLHPESIPEPSALVNRIASLQTLRMTPIELFKQFQMPVQKQAQNIDKTDQDARKAARKQAGIIMYEAVQARILRAIYGPRQLQEVMAAFWFNHFNVFAAKGLCHLWIGAYEEEAIRPHTMGRFRDLLGATAKHPAMLFYLDNWQNNSPNSSGKRGKFEGINENYAREVMELHTLGVNGGYTQADVTALAHILTGWGLQKRGQAGMGMGAPEINPGMHVPGGMSRMGGWGPWWRRPARRAPLPGALGDQYGFYFDPSRHDFSEQVVLGRSYSGGAGIAAGEQALDVLARAPATARHLSYQLAQYFVADNPPQTLVARMAERFEQSQGDIRATLETLFFSPEFWDERYYGAKFKTPYDYVISAVRVTGAPEITNYGPLFGTMPLLAPPFEAGGGGGPAFRVKFKNGGGGAKMLELNPPGNGSPGNKGPRMNPPEPAQLVASLGGSFSTNTREAIEAAPVQLRSALVLGSPEFMVR